MKNNKKGFTLVELLAVIVILAIIALIATPIILNVIDDARKNSARNSAYGYIDAVEKWSAQQMLNQQADFSLNGKYTKNTLSGVTVKGDTPTDVTLNYTNGKLTTGCMIVNGYKVTIADGKIAKDAVSSTKETTCTVSGS